jgi:D-alanyl-D-alanine carboxypeptidase (penicillin-binding protein 5/6)
MIAVVLGSETSDDRFNTAKRLLNWGFANYASVVPNADQSLLTPVRVLRGESREITPDYTATPLLVPKGGEGDLQQQVALSADVQAPVEKGQILGKITFSLDGETLGSVPLTAPSAVGKLELKTVFKRLLAALWN